MTEQYFIMTSSIILAMIMQTVPVDPKFEMIIEYIVIFLASILMVVGGGGLLVTITAYKSSSDSVLQYGMAFVQTYMLVFGIIMMKLRKNLIFRRRI